MYRISKYGKNSTTGSLTTNRPPKKGFMDEAGVNYINDQEFANIFSLHFD
jgi:hypothetical protein